MGTDIHPLTPVASFATVRMTHISQLLCSALLLASTFPGL